MKRLAILVVILSAFVLSDCGKYGATPPIQYGRVIEAPGGSYTLLSVYDLHALPGVKDYTLVNVHTPYEGELDKTDLFIVYNEIADNLARLPAKDAKIVLYCASGGMSKPAALTLVSLGYTNVYDVKGGMAAWESAGYPLLWKAH